MVPTSWHSSNESSCFTINSSFSANVNPDTRALYRLISTGMTAFALYVKEYGVSLVDLLEVVRYAHKMFGNSSVHLPLVPSSLLFSPLITTLLVVSA